MARKTKSASVGKVWPGAFGIYKISRDGIRKNIGAIIVLICAYFAAEIIIGILVGFNMKQIEWRIAGQVLSSFIAIYFTVVLTRINLASARQQRTSLDSAGSRTLVLVFKLLLLNLLVFISVLGGVVLLVVPGIIIALRLSLAQYYLVDQGLSVMDAYKASWHATKGNLGKLWGIFGVSVLIFLPVFTVIGILATIYFWLMYSAAHALLYLYTSKKSRPIRKAAIPTVMKAVWVLGVIATVVLIFLYGRLVHSLNSSLAKSELPQAHVFTSSDYDFKIDFPGKPTTNKYTLKTTAGKSLFVYTVYLSSIDNDTQNFTVVVYPWPMEQTDFIDMTQSQLKSALVDDLNGDMRAAHAKPATIKAMWLFSGHTLAEEAQFTRPGKGYTITGYDRVFTIGNVEYDIMAQNSGRAAFDAFADSFQYTGSDNGGLSDSANESGTVSNGPTDQSSVKGDAANSPTDVPSDGSVSNSPTGDDGASKLNPAANTPVDTLQLQ